MTRENISLPCLAARKTSIPCCPPLAVVNSSYVQKSYSRTIPKQEQDASDASKLLILISVLHGTGLGLRVGHEHPARNHARRSSPPRTRSDSGLPFRRCVISIRRDPRGDVCL